MRPFVLALAFSLPTATVAHAQPDRCTAARSAREYALCSDSKLADLNRQLSTVYERLQAQLSPEAAAAIQSDQKEWLAATSQICSGADIPSSGPCFEHPYSERLQQLQQGTVAGSSPTIYTRAHIFVFPRKGGDPRSASNPVFGILTFEWPQIDRPTPQQETWNTAVRDAAVRLALGHKAATEPFPAVLDAAAAPDVELSSYYLLNAANEHLVEVGLIQYTYSGGAHGMTNSASFIWLFGPNRQLQASDIFREGSNWQQQIVTQTIARLQAQPDLRPMLWKGKELEDGAAGATDPRHWQISRDGLTISFDQYEVAAYAAGGGSVDFTWDELNPLLSPGFNPDDLPAPIPETSP